MHVGTVLMGKLRWISVVIGVWFLPWGAATASPDAPERPASSNFSTHRALGLEIRAAGALSSSGNSGREPSPETPFLQTRPKQFFRVLNDPELSFGGRAECERQTSLKEELARCDFSPPELWAIGRCILLCRFLL